MREPGLDRHEWETEWEALQPDLETSPGETLPELDALVRRMLEESGFALGDDPVAAEGEDEIVGAYYEAREITRSVDRGDDVPPGDIGEAVNRYRDLYEHILSQPRE